MHFFIRSLLAWVLSVAPVILVNAGGIREHTRPPQTSGTHVNHSQAIELTLTLVRAEQQNLQIWIRLAAVIDASGRYLSAKLCSPDINLIRVGQRLRVFSPDSKSSVYQARITQLNKHNACMIIKARLSGTMQQQGRYYVIEIIVSRGRYFSIPKEAIIEEGDGKEIVYLQRHAGHYIPQQIHSGLKGELYTEILHGLNQGDQVVSLGSFFIDAEYKLKSATQSGAGHAHQHH